MAEASDHAAKMSFLFQNRLEKKTSNKKDYMEDALTKKKRQQRQQLKKKKTTKKRQQMRGGLHREDALTSE